MHSPSVSELSAGIIPFCGIECRSRKYLILRYASGEHWGFPKGHVEPCESPRQAALRELGEETSLAVDSLITDFCRSIDYYYRRDGVLFHKTVIFFLGKVIWRKIRLSPEHLDYKWVPPSEAVSLLTFDNTRQLLNAAEKFLVSDCSEKE